MYDTTKAKQYFRQVMIASIEDKDMPLYFQQYCSRKFNNEKKIDEYFNHCQEIAERLEIRGKKVLFIGCGFGFRDIIFGLLGAEEVIGVDLYESKIESFQKILSRINPPLRNVHPAYGDWLEMGHDKAYFDTVILIEVISHVRETGVLLEKIHFVLKPGGILYISDGNNGLHLPTRLKLRKVWRRVENGPVDENMGHSNALSYFEMRKKIISERYPNLDDEKIKLLSKKTQGLYGKEVFDAVSEYMTNGNVKIKPDFLYRDPYTGVCEERAFNYLQLRKLLEKHYFLAKRIPRQYKRKNIRDFNSFFKELVKCVMNYFLIIDFIGIFSENTIEIKAKKIN